MQINTLRAEQRRQLVDSQQIYAAWRESAQRKRSFAGGMRWIERGGKRYLMRKIGKSERSLGPQSEQTEATYAAFMQGRKDIADRMAGLTARLDQLAPVNVALGLGRAPAIVGKILRACDRHGLLGKLTVVGTNALWAYEVEAGVHFESGLVSTGDVDFLLDARQHIGFVATERTADSLIGLLRKVDRTFHALPNGYSAANDDGYFVDLIRPESKDVLRERTPASVLNLSDDLQAVAIFGLSWLIDSPKMETVAVDEKGYPFRIVVVDPRVFALHKAWMAQRRDRERLKAVRDLEQAKATAAVTREYLRKDFYGADLTALPKTLQDLRTSLG